MKQPLFSFEPLAGLSNALSQLAPRGAHNLTILWMDGRWLKLVQLSGRPGARTVSKLFAHAIEGLSDEEIIAWLQQTCTVQQVEPGTVLVANPAHLTTTRLFTLPSTDPGEIRDIVELQAEKHTPYAKEEILIDFHILESDRGGYSRVQLVLSHQDIVHRVLRIVEGMGWILEHVGFELDGLVNWFKAANRDPATGTLIAELDNDSTTVVIFQHGKPFFHRSLALGVTQLLHDPEAVDKLAAELRRSLESFESEGFNLPVAAVVLTGQAGRVPQLAERVHQALDLPAESVDPFQGVELSDEAKLAHESLSQHAFTSLVGLGLGPSPVDLTPKALKLHRAFEARAKTLVSLGCQLIGGLLLVSCLIIGRAYQTERYHAGLLQQERTLRAQSDNLEVALEQFDLVERWLGSRGVILEAVTELAHQTPDTIRWQSFSFTKNDQIVIKGTSQEMPKVFEFATQLKQSPLFSKVEARRVSKKKVGEETVTEFEIVCSLAGAGTTEKPKESG